MKKIHIIIFLMLLVMTSIAFSQIPRIINYQGLLVGSDGQIFPEGQYDLTFSLYNEAGDLLWTEIHQQVSIKGGMFQVHLGSFVALELPFNQEYFLGIRVNNDPEMEPRMLLTSSAYSLKSANTESLEGFRLSEVPMPNHILPLDSTGMFPKSVIPPDSGGNSGGGIGGSGTANYIPRFNSEFTLGNSILYQSNGNIGIGTTSPTYKFELAGFDAKIYGLTIGRGGGGVGTNTAFGIEALNSNATGMDNSAFGLQTLFSNTDGWGNLAVGRTALYNNIQGSINTAIGCEALFNNKSGGANTAVGYQAMYKQNFSETDFGTRNTAVGERALYGSDILTNNSGENNTAVGSYALFNNSSGAHNVAIGVNSLSANQTGVHNTAVGEESLYSNTTGKRNTAIGFSALETNRANTDNTAVGNFAMYNANDSETGTNTNNTAVGSNALRGSSVPSNNTGIYNTAVGTNSMLENTSGSGNTAVGYLTLNSNTTGGTNTAIGNLSLMDNTIGNWNTACGAAALSNNTEGRYNTAVGLNSANQNLTGDDNTSVGNESLNWNKTGFANTCIGSYSGSRRLNISTGTFIGAGCWAETDNLENVTGLGYSTRITASNQVRIGNSSVTSIGGYTNWTDFSDERYKTSVQENVKGLDFIMKLHPITYKLDLNKLSAALKENEKNGSLENISKELSSSIVKSRNAKSQITYSGFSAQEVEKIAREIGYDFSGVDAPKNGNDFYGLRYAEFVVPLVKAVQEQQQIIEELKRRVEELERR